MPVNKIGDIEIGSIQELSIGSSVSTREMNIYDESKNVLVSSEFQPYRIDINFRFSQSQLPRNVGVDRQRNRIKNLSENSMENNTFVYSDYFAGYISIESVNVPESSQSRNLIDGDISGVYLPWPKNFSENARPS
jgi:hypothetical protein